MYRGYLVDVFGTLVEDDESRILAVCKLIAERSGAGVDEVEAEWETRLWAAAEAAHGARFRTLADLNTGSLAATAAHFGVPVDLQELQAQQMAPLFADSLRFLDRLQGRGAPVCLVSDADRGDLEKILLHHRVVVEGVVTSEDARAYKPRAEPFLMALAKLGMDPGDVLHVGDSVAADLAGAAALGIDAALVDRTGRGLPSGARAAYVVRTLAELP